MENLNKNILLGINPESKEIYFGEIEITTRNGYKEFSTSFNVGEALNIDDVDLQEQCEYLWECYDAQQKIELLYDGDRTREDVFDEWTRYSNYKEFVDCSCTDIEVTLESGETINFQTTYGGQHDIRENKENYSNIIFTDKKAVEKILNLWDLYHLKNIEKNIGEIQKNINYIIEKIGKYTIYSNDTKKFITNNLKEL